MGLIVRDSRLLVRDGKLLTDGNGCCCDTCYSEWETTYDCDTKTWSAVTAVSAATCGSTCTSSAWVADPTDLTHYTCAVCSDNCKTDGDCAAVTAPSHPSDPVCGCAQKWETTYDAASSTWSTVTAVGEPECGIVPADAETWKADPDDGCHYTRYTLFPPPLEGEECSDCCGTGATNKATYVIVGLINPGQYCDDYVAVNGHNITVWVSHSIGEKIDITPYWNFTGTNTVEGIDTAYIMRGMGAYRIDVCQGGTRFSFSNSGFPFQYSDWSKPVPQPFNTQIVTRPSPDPTVAPDPPSGEGCTFCQGVPPLLSQYTLGFDFVGVGSYSVHTGRQNIVLTHLGGANRVWRGRLSFGDEFALHCNPADRGVPGFWEIVGGIAGYILDWHKHTGSTPVGGGWEKPNGGSDFENCDGVGSFSNLAIS